MASATLSQLRAEIEYYSKRDNGETSRLSGVYSGRKNGVWQASHACQTWQACYFVGAGVAVVAAGALFALFLLLFL